MNGLTDEHEETSDAWICTLMSVTSHSCPECMPRFIWAISFILEETKFNVFNRTVARYFPVTTFKEMPINIQCELWRELTYKEYSNKIPSTSNMASITPFLSQGF